MCITHTHRPQCCDGKREGVAGAGWNEATLGGDGGMGTSVIVSIIKIKQK